MTETGDILDKIVAYKRKEVVFSKQQYPEAMIRSLAERSLESSKQVSMRQALTCSPSGIIAEYKRKSPSKGWFNEEEKAGVIPLDYQQNGAASLSILTDEYFFGGSDTFIQAARNSGVTLPILYKNFIIDEYQLSQAVLSGASAVLLIAAVLTKEECRLLIRKAHELKLEVLLEMHSEAECRYAEFEPDMYGINNRHLGSFKTDVRQSFLMADYLPKDVCKVSESGISDPAVVRQLREVGYRGFLMGEYFMKRRDPGVALRQFIDQVSLAQEG